ncbi:hypothetical protein EAH79_02200 [Sphingomonas koreensis]|nr:hypothetical protein EAH87_12115 [Sphingomonas koreensis]TPG42704.1 hypothetical protein EAH79_02200 [Sphingomonas koreensis]
MKITKIIAAVGLIAATLGTSVSANAQHHRVVTKRVVTSHTRRAPARVVHRRVVHHQVCNTVWRHHRRVRVCR